MKMYREGSFNDVNIKLHDGEIKANKSVLAARCEYFAATFRWKNNNSNYHDVEEIVVNDCSKKIMTRIIEYIFSGFLEAKGLSLLEFLELKDQVRKMFPGDEIEIDMGTFFKETKREPLPCPTSQEIVRALSLVESGNLQSQVLAELGTFIEKEIEYSSDHQETKILALASLAHYGVIDVVKKIKLYSEEKEETTLYLVPLDLGLVPSDHLQALIPSVTEVMNITNVINYDMTSLLDSVICKELRLTQRLNKEETEALVRAMTSRVEILRLVSANSAGSGNGVVSLDIDTLN